MQDFHQLALFHRTLAELCRSEMPLGRAFALLEADLARGPLKEAVRALAADVEAGTPLADAYRKRPDAFPPLYAALVEAGIASGDLAGTLEEIARHATLRAEIGTRLRRALAYPLIAASFVFAVGTYLFFFVAPSAFELLAELRGDATSAIQTWRAPSRSFGLGAEVWIILGLCLFTVLAIAVGLVFFAWIRNAIDGAPSPHGRAWRLPVIGPLRLYAVLASVTATIALLIRRGLSLARALDLAAAAAGSREIRATLETMARAARDGSGLGDAIRTSGLLPASLLWLVGAAEARGEAAAALDDVARIYRDRLERGVDRLAVVVTPALELLIGFVVLAFAYSFVAPVFEVIRFMRYW